MSDNYSYQKGYGDTPISTPTPISHTQSQSSVEEILLIKVNELVDRTSSCEANIKSLEQNVASREYVQKELRQQNNLSMTRIWSRRDTIVGCVFTILGGAIGSIIVILFDMGVT